MNKLELDIYLRMTEGKACSRRTIRKYTTGAERSTVRSWVKYCCSVSRPRNRGIGGSMTWEPIKADGLPECLEGDWWEVVNNSYSEWRDNESTLIPAESRPEVGKVIEVWWTSNGSGDLGEDIWTELSLYAVVRFTDGRWGYVEAWNDYTGWGCQDGVEWSVCDTPKELEFRMTNEGRDRLKWRANAEKV